MIGVMQQSPAQWMRNWLMVAIAVATALPTLAHAWTRIDRCSEYERIAGHIHVVRITLRCPGLTLLGTLQNDSMMTTSEFAGKTGATIAVNANFFDMKRLKPHGAVVTEGRRWPGSSDRYMAPELACAPSSKCEVVTDAAAAAQGRFDTVVSGLQYYSEGVFKCPLDAPPSCAGANWQLKHPRTAAGLADGGATLYLIAAEGRIKDFSGLTIDELGEVMSQLRVETGLNLDGGGSTTLIIHGKRVNSLPRNQQDERKVSNHLGIQVVPE